MHAMDCHEQVVATVYGLATHTHDAMTQRQARGMLAEMGALQLSVRIVVNSPTLGLQSDICVLPRIYYSYSMEDERRYLLQVPCRWRIVWVFSMD